MIKTSPDRSSKVRETGAGRGRKRGDRDPGVSIGLWNDSRAGEGMGMEGLVAGPVTSWVPVPWLDIVMGRPCKPLLINA